MGRRKYNSVCVKILGGKASKEYYYNFVPCASLHYRLQLSGLYSWILIRSIARAPSSKSQHQHSFSLLQAEPSQAGPGTFPRLGCICPASGYLFFRQSVRSTTLLSKCNRRCRIICKPDQIVVVLVFIGWSRQPGWKSSSRSSLARCGNDNVRTLFLLEGVAYYLCWTFDRISLQNPSLLIQSRCSEWELTNLLDC